MPSTLLLTLQLEGPAPDGPHIPLHAISYQLINHASSVEARRLHETQLNPLSQHLARTAGFGGVLGHDRRTLQFRLNTLDDALLPLLQDAFAPGLPLPEPRGALLRGQVIGQVTAMQDYDDLLEGGPSRAVRMTFMTPTVLRSGNQFHARPRAAWTYHGLLRRWNAFAPRAFRPDVWSALTDDLRTDQEATRIHTLAVPGSSRHETLQAFTGTLDVRTGTERSAGPLGTLTRFAPFAGVGAKTMYGFGAVQTHVWAPDAEHPPPDTADAEFY